MSLKLLDRHIRGGALEMQPQQIHAGVIKLSAFILI